MYSRKSVGPRIDPWRTPALTGYFCEDFPPRTKWKNKVKYLTWNYVRLKFVKKTSMSNSFESLGYIKCYSSSSPRPFKCPSNSIRYNCQKICNWSGRPKTTLEIRKKVTFLHVINNVQDSLWKYYAVSD